MSSAWAWWAGPAGAVAFVALVLGPDAGHWLAWQAVLAVLALVALPLAVRLWRAVPSAAFAFSGALGVAVVGYVVWLAAHLHLAPFTAITAWVVALLVAAALWIPPGLRRGVTDAVARPEVVRTWAGFAGAFVVAGGAWTYVRSTMPAVDGLEKFMNLGFMNSLWRTSWLPAPDMWLSGESINYYYYGQYTYTLLSKLAGLPPHLSYNLALASTMAFVVTLVAGIAHLMLRLSGMGALARRVGLVLMVFLVAFAGNAHSFFYAGPGKPLLGLLAAAGVDVGQTDGFYFTHSTRFIGHNPPVETDQTIAEFPYYSFLVADLHAHVVDTAFVLLFLGVLIAWLHAWGERTPRPTASVGWADALTDAARPWLVVSAFLLGLMAMTNYWDFVIHYVVAVMVLLVGHLRTVPVGTAPSIAAGLLGIGATLVTFLVVADPVALVLVLAVLAVGLSAIHGLLPGAVSRTAAVQAALFALAHVVSLTFNIGFEPISKDIALVTARTAPWQLVVMWGPIVLVTGAFAVWLVRRIRRDRALAVPDAAALVLVVAGLGLLAAPEVLFVKDIYIATNPRANTMFKFTFQAFIMLGLAAGYGVARVWGSVPRSRASTVLGAVMAAALVMPAWYPFVATFQWVPPALTRIGLDGSRWMEGSSLSTRVEGTPVTYGPTGDLAAIRWLDAHVAGQPVILEAAGASYTHFGRISAYTGLPTVLGWDVHEWLWRTSKERPQARDLVVVPRQDDVRAVYEATDAEAARAILAEYDVRYIVIGELERLNYPQLNEPVLRQLGTEVFAADGTAILQVR
ncbi:MAG: DUF2298 domain-containing protein [Propionibacteriaceae bacterium]|nr:DUF2298 domain-containing protein [Propionibacteriaceae bacterium]